MWKQLLQDYEDAPAILQKKNSMNTLMKTSDYSIPRLMIPLLIMFSNLEVVPKTSYSRIIYYMKIHRSLYKFSQQRWEILNKFNHILINHSQCGGNYGSNVGKSERYWLIFFWNSRESQFGFQEWQKITL
jgi:hypothetical protein